MRYVLDSNVALKWVLPEADSDQAIRLRDGLLRGTDQLDDGPRLAFTQFATSPMTYPCLALGLLRERQAGDRAKATKILHKARAA